MIEGRQLQELTQHDSMRLLASVPVGRVVFTHHALPAIRAVNHIVVGDKIVIIAALGSAISMPASVGSRGYDGTVVAYEADLMDPDTHLGWSVVVIGTACVARDQAEISGYRAALQPWVAGATDDVIVIQAELVTGYQLVAAATPQLPIG
ncbi:MAG TPA: pyridoxamine 5'-phosphate oxidase family protein [Streptosporangiaceae bacterium]|jgi:hypothetical protein